MALNLTIESPNIEKITTEAGQFTSEAINTLWAALNDTRAELRRNRRSAKEGRGWKALSIAPTTSVDDLDVSSARVLEFTGSTAVNFTGMRAPETDETKVVFVIVSGSATITAKHNVTSETANQLVNTSGGDVSLATNAGIVYVYTSGKWREVA